MQYLAVCVASLLELCVLPYLPNALICFGKIKDPCFAQTFNFTVAICPMTKFHQNVKNS